MKCIDCGKYPFCNRITNSKQECCEKFVKRKLMITTIGPLGNKRTIEIYKEEINNEKEQYKWNK